MLGPIRREVVVGALVPVHCRTSEVFRAGRIPVHRSRPLVQACAVLVVAENVQVSQAIGLECWAQMILNEFRHLVRRVEHTFPVVAVAVGFILHRKAPQRDVIFLAFLGILNEELRPRRLHFLQQPPPTQSPLSFIQGGAVHGEAISRNHLLKPVGPI